MLAKRRLLLRRIQRAFAELQNNCSLPAPIQQILTAAVDRLNSWSSSRTGNTSYYSTNNVALIVPK